MQPDAEVLYRRSSRRYADPSRVESHPPTAGAAPNTCTTCRHAIGYTNEDRVHWVPRPCVGRCGTLVNPPGYICPSCQQRDDERREQERLARLAGRVPVVETEAEDFEEQVERVERDREGHNPKYREAKEYASTYSGTFEFMLDMKRRVTGPRGVRGPLSDRQVESILKCKAADLARQQRQVERVRHQSGRDLSVLPVGRTAAAVDNDEGGITFLLIDRPAPTSKWGGWVFVKQQQGPNEVRLGSQRPGETYVGQWPSLIDKVLADPVGAVARYGLELGVCGVCFRPLTNDESRELGIGPVCRAKIAA